MAQKRHPKECSVCESTKDVSTLGFNKPLCAKCYLKALNQGKGDN